jgi:hypothetical protein
VRKRNEIEVFSLIIALRTMPDMKIISDPLTQKPNFLLKRKYHQLGSEQKWN